MTYYCILLWAETIEMQCYFDEQILTILWL